MMSTCSPAFAPLRSTAWHPIASVSTSAHCSAREARCHVQLARREDDSLSKSAVAHNPERLVLLAAIRESAPAGVTPLAIEIRFNRTAIARLHVLHPLAHGKHLHSQFVARDPGVREKGHLSQITAEIGAADTDAMHA
jgi:hypothetical protein